MLKILFFLFTLSAIGAEPHFIAGCRVLKRNGDIIMTFPGRNCAFQKDGRVVSLSSDSLRLFESGGKIVWKQKLPTSKTIFSMSRDEEKILLVSEKKGDLPGDPVNFLLNVLDMNGKRIVSAETFILFPDRNLMVTDFREGKTGYFVSLYGDGVYDLDEALRLTGRKVVLAKNNEVEEVQLTPEGNMFYLVRPASVEFRPDPVVYAEEMDLKKNRPVFRYPAKPSAGFYFPRGGSLSLHNDMYVINHPLSGSYLVSRKSGKLQDYVTKTHFDINQIRIPEEVILTDLSAFLERWAF